MRFLFPIVVRWHTYAVQQSRLHILGVLYAKRAVSFFRCRYDVSR